jgi:two-component system, NarL family, sensor histidine kinase LiaS
MNFRNWMATFNKLQWKLTLFYTVVTVIALAVLQLILLVVIGQKLLYDNPILSTIQITYLRQIGDQTADALDAEQVNRAALASWMDTLEMGGGTGRDASKPKGFYSRLPSDSYVLAVTDSQGTVLAANSAKLTWVDFSIFALTPPEADEIILQAASGEEDATQLYRLIDSAMTASAAPIFDSTGQSVVGVIYLQYDLPTIYEIIPNMISIPHLVFLTLFAGLVGIVFGTLVTRGLTRRLSALTQMTSLWGKGDFTQTYQDDMGDEISQLADDLNRTAVELQQLVQTRQDMAILEERNRLARDLHDNVKQQMFAMTMNLGAAQTLWSEDPATALGKIEAATELGQQMQTDLSGLINALRPVQMENKPLIDALREYILTWEKRSNAATIFQVEGTESRLPAETEQALYLVTQEALSNISRHSHATAASLSIKFQSTQVWLTITDNGRGFDPTTTTSGLGLQSMKERIQAVGGDFKVSSAPSEGTRIIFDVPSIKEESES